MQFINFALQFVFSYFSATNYTGIFLQKKFNCTKMEDLPIESKINSQLYTNIKQEPPDVNVKNELQELQDSGENNLVTDSFHANDNNYTNDNNYANVNNYESEPYDSTYNLWSFLVYR